MIFDMKMVLFASLLLFLPVASEASKLKPFESDGCTLFVSGPPGKPKLWEHCCYEHDLRYWFGGSVADMDFSDREIRSCVKKVAGQSWADLIYEGIVAGHRSPVKSRYFWSWGWRPQRSEEPLRDEEVELVIKELFLLPLEPGFREEFILKYLKR